MFIALLTLLLLLGCIGALFMIISLDIRDRLIPRAKERKDYVSVMYLQVALGIYISIVLLALLLGFLMINSFFNGGVH